MNEINPDYQVHLQNVPSVFLYFYFSLCMQDTDVVTDISNMVFLAGAAAAEASEASDSAAAALLAEGGAPDVKPPTKRECVDVVVYLWVCSKANVSD